jgi:hypothetical protein
MSMIDNFEVVMHDQESNLNPLTQLEAFRIHEINKDRHYPGVWFY